MKIVLVLAVLAMASCAPESSSSSDGGGDTGSATDETQDTAAPTPADDKGQIQVTVPGEIKLDSVEGYVVGQQDKTIALAGDTLFVDNVEPGTVDVMITGSLNIASLTNGDNTHGTRVNGIKVEAGKVKDVGDVEMPELGSIEGKVILLEPEGTTDFAGIDVYIPGTDLLAKTDTAGAFAISGVPVGTHNLFFEKDGYHRGVAEGVEVSEGTATTTPEIGLLLKTDSLGGLVIEGGKSAVNSKTVVLNVIPSDGAVLMKISEDSNFSDASFKPLVTATEWVFETEGEKTLYIQFADANGQNSSTFNDSINVDLSGPTGSFEISGGADFTSSQTVSLSLTFSDALSSVEELMVSESSEFSGADWEDYAAEKTLNLSSGDGEKTLYVKTRDVFGQESDSASQSITLDTQAPIIVASSEVPADSATNVGFLSTDMVSVGATFSEAIQSSTLDASSFSITATGHNVDVFPSYDSNTKAFSTLITFLNPGTTYTATITTDVLDQAGNAISGAHSWTFTTKSGWMPINTATTTPIYTDDNDPSAQRAVAAADPNGNAAFIFDAELDGTRKVYIKQYLDGVYQNLVELDTPPTGFADADIAFNSSGDGVAVWAGTGNELNYSFFDSTTKTWSAKAAITGAGAGNCGSADALNIAFADNGDVAVGFTGFACVNGKAVVYDADSGGGTWSAVESLSSGTNHKIHVGLTSAQHVFAIYPSGTGTNNAAVKIYNGTTWGSERILGRSQTEDADNSSGDSYISTAKGIWVFANGDAMVLLDEQIDVAAGTGCSDECFVTAHRYVNGSGWDAVSVDIYVSTEVNGHTISPVGTSGVVATFTSAGGDAFMNYFDGTSWGTAQAVGNSFNTYSLMAGEANGKVLVVFPFSSNVQYQVWDPNDAFSSANFSAIDYVVDASFTDGSSVQLSRAGQVGMLTWYRNSSHNLYFTHYK